MHSVQLRIAITDPDGNELSHKLMQIRAAEESGVICTEGVVFRDRVPSGSFCALLLLEGDKVLSSEKKIIPDSSYYQEGAQMASVILDDVREVARCAGGLQSGREKLPLQPFRQRVDAWVKLLIDENGSGSLLCHVGNPGENQPKAIFEANFKL
jgi:hypothetical protein